MERVTWKTYITICKIDSQWEFAVWLRELKQRLYQPRGVGWRGRWEGGSRGRGYMYTYGWFMLRFDRKQQNSVNQLSFKKYFFKKKLKIQSLSNDFMKLLLIHNINIRKWVLIFIPYSCLQFSSVAQSCLTLCNPLNHSTPGLPVHHQLLKSIQTHVYWVGDAIQPCNSSFSKFVEKPVCL